jgi:hypothetical protein
MFECRAVPSEGVDIAGNAAPEWCSEEEKAKEELLALLAMPDEGVDGTGVLPPLGSLRTLQFL